VGRKGKRIRSALLATAATAASLAAPGSAAGLPLEIGFTDHFGPPPPALCINPDPIDLVQATGPAAPSYTVPAAPGQSLVITSWSHHAAPGSAPLGFKVYRPVSGSIYRVVAHEGPRPLTSGAVNTFSGLHIPVLPGDVIGLHTGAAPTACHFNQPGQSYLFRSGDLADGQEGAFSQNTGELLNVSALVEIDNRLTVSKVKRNKKRGTAKITLDIPNPGVLHLAGAGVLFRGARHRQVSSGAISLPIRAFGRTKETLLSKGKVKVVAQFSYVPTGGRGAFLPLKLTLRKLLG
jgi:hypothetical protein